MPITVQWDDDANTILRLVYIAPWTWDEFFEAFDEATGLVRRADYEVSVINDGRHAGQPPPDLLGHVQATIEVLPANLGLMIVAESEFYGKTVVQLLQQMYPDSMSNWRITPTVDAARAMIREWRSHRQDKEERLDAD
jgi:hypothetical protein